MTSAGDRDITGRTSHGELSRQLDVASGRGGPGSKITCGKITRNADIRSTTRSATVMVSIRIMLSSWELPIVSAYRNRTDDLRITRGTLSCLTCTSCTDITGHRTDSTRCAGIIRRRGPRTGPSPKASRLRGLRRCATLRTIRLLRLACRLQVVRSHAPNVLATQSLDIPRELRLITCCEYTPSVCSEVLVFH